MDERIEKKSRGRVKMNDESEIECKFGMKGTLRLRLLRSQIERTNKYRKLLDYLNCIGLHVKWKSCSSFFVKKKKN